MEQKQFQAESKKLMDMMINSIYTNKEIFLRELISNASDAIDKLYYKSLTDPSVGMNKGDFRILITRDKENRILTVEDNGIGMSQEFAQKIFEPFERERTSTVSRIQGTGLGMAITKNIVDMMGGDNAPLAVLEGAAAAVKEYGVQLIGVGDEALVRKTACLLYTSDAADEL